MLQNAYFLAKIGADTAENEQHFAEILPTNFVTQAVPAGLQVSSFGPRAGPLAALTSGRVVRKIRSPPLQSLKKHCKLRNMPRLPHSTRILLNCNIGPFSTVSAQICCKYMSQHVLRSSPTHNPAGSDSHAADFWRNAMSSPFRIPALRCRASKAGL